MLIALIDTLVGIAFVMAAYKTIVSIWDDGDYR